MHFKKFLVTTVLLFLVALLVHLFTNSFIDINSGDTYYVFNLSYLFTAAGLTMVVPTLLLMYIELFQKKTAAPKLTKISFVFHLSGVLILLSTMLFYFVSAQIELIPLLNVFIYLGLFLTVAGMSMIPAILMISLRKN